MRGACLQTGEKHVIVGHRTGHKHANPADYGREEREECTRGSYRQSDGGGHARVVHEVCYGHDQANHVDGLLQLLPCAVKLLQSLTDGNFRGERREQSRHQNGGTRRTQNVPVEDCVDSEAFTVANLVVDTGHVEAQVCKTQGSVMVKDGAQHGGPEQDGDGKEDEGAPGARNFPQTVRRFVLRGELFQGRCGGLAINVLGLPETHHDRQEHQSDKGRQNADELGVLQDPQHDALQARNHDTGCERY